MGGDPNLQQYLAVSCQNCGAMIPVPAHVLDRQIVLAEDPCDVGHRSLSTLLNLRCRACHREYFYHVKEVVQAEGIPRSFAEDMRRHHRRAVAPAHHHELTHA
jgi:hypothetical protein